MPPRLTTGISGLFVYLTAFQLGGDEPADWPGWRGPDGAGVWTGVRLPEKLTGDSIERRWRVPLGGGYSGIAVRGARVFTQDRPKGPPALERVVCLDRKTGGSIWLHSYGADYGDMDHPNGPRATPLVRDGLVYALGAVGHLVCLEESTGALVWKADLVKEFQAKVPTWGHSASPLFWRDLLLVHAGARPGGTLLAVDAKTGKERWRALGDRPGYSTPIVVRLDGRDQVLLWTADGAHGIDPSSGARLWQAPFETSSYDVAIISPVFRGKRVFVSGYWDGAEAFEIEDAGKPRSVWKARVPSCLMATPLQRDGHLFVLDKNRGLLCLDWETGKVLWDDGHKLTPSGRNPHASLVWADGRCAALNSEGELVVARLSSGGYEEIGRAAIISPTWAHPAFAGREVFARSDSEIVCVALR